MRDASTEIIDDMLEACKVGHPDFNAHGFISAVYDRYYFEDLFQTIGDLYHTLVAFHIPTKYLKIDVGVNSVWITLDYKGLKILCPEYGEEEEDEE